ncbi:hypothetical protein [Anaerospora hongkongensis]|uniref:hypothetical protein n=1 Tax=Anaerospora hongkongensis TaxID=244830 RepID=UPI0028967D03|nr:hypothetical protein [Anaerospora hongkongensis]
MSVLCNREDCKFNFDQLCNVGQVGIVDRQCVTYRRVKRKEDYQQLMRQPYNANCHPTAKGYKSSPVLKVWK